MAIGHVVVLLRHEAKRMSGSDGRTIAVFGRSAMIQKFPVVSILYRSDLPASTGVVCTAVRRANAAAMKQRRIGARRHFAPQVSQRRKGVAKCGAGNLHQAGERFAQLKNQKDRSSRGEREDKQGHDGKQIQPGKHPETRKDDGEPED